MKKALFVIIGLLSIVFLTVFFFSHNNGALAGIPLAAIMLFVIFKYIVPFLWRMFKPILAFTLSLSIFLSVALFFFIQFGVGQKLIPEWLQLVIAVVGSLWLAIKAFSTLDSGTNK